MWAGSRRPLSCGAHTEDCVWPTFAVESSVLGLWGCLAPDWGFCFPLGPGRHFPPGERKGQPILVAKTLVFLCYWSEWLPRTLGMFVECPPKPVRHPCCVSLPWVSRHHPCWLWTWDRREEKPSFLSVELAVLAILLMGLLRAAWLCQTWQTFLFAHSSSPGTLVVESPCHSWWVAEILERQGAHPELCTRRCNLLCVAGGPPPPWLSV